MIPEINKILFATDLSDNARHAFDYAASIATRYDASMVLLHVLESAPDSAREQIKSMLGAEKWRQMEEEHRESARERLIDKRTDYTVIQRALGFLCDDAHRDSPRCSFQAEDLVVTQGHISERILEVAEQKQCDLIVLGAHKGLLGGTAVGSVAKAVLHGARVPVVVVPPPAPA